MKYLNSFADFEQQISEAVKSEENFNRFINSIQNDLGILYAVLNCASDILNSVAWFSKDIDEAKPVTHKYGSQSLFYIMKLFLMVLSDTKSKRTRQIQKMFSAAELTLDDIDHAIFLWSMNKTCKQKLLERFIERYKSGLMTDTEKSFFRFSYEIEEYSETIDTGSVVVFETTEDTDVQFIYVVNNCLIDEFGNIIDYPFAKDFVQANKFRYGKLLVETVSETVVYYCNRARVGSPLPVLNLCSDPFRLIGNISFNIADFKIKLLQPKIHKPVTIKECSELVLNIGSEPYKVLLVTDNKGTQYSVQAHNSFVASNIKKINFIEFNNTFYIK